MTSTAQQIRVYEGPAILSFGFRPLFLSGAIWAALAMCLWVGVLSGYLSVPSVFTAIDWHAHELLYGYLPAVMAGFLLTAIPNWTGRLPVTGNRLLVLVLFWMAGRLAVLMSSYIGLVWTAVIDLSFLAVFGWVVAREIVAGRNWRNLKVLILVGLLFVGNGVFHFEVGRAGSAASGFGARIGIAAAVLLIVVIGGRIVPSFTRNWLARHSITSLPATFGRFDVASIAVTGLGLVAWVALPDRWQTAVVCLVAGAAQLVRLFRWSGHRTFPEPLVWILHLGYLFIPLGFLAISCAALAPGIIPSTAALHAWTAGAIGVMSLAVMTRASLGHSGRPLSATSGTLFIYLSIFGSAVLRVVSGIGSSSQVLLYLAASFWVLAFVGFAAFYGPMLARPKPRRQVG